MAVIALVPFGTFERRVNSARHALKTWGYRLVKLRGASTLETARFAIVDRETGKVVAGNSVEAPALTLIAVEDWFNNQGFAGRVAADGSLIRDLSLDGLTGAQRDIIASMRALPIRERLELARLFSTWLLKEKLG